METTKPDAKANHNFWQNLSINRDGQVQKLERLCLGGSDGVGL